MKIYELNAQIIIEVPNDTNIYTPIPKQQGRYKFEGDTVLVYDVLLENGVSPKLNELQNQAGALISNVDLATDRTAVNAYLSTFVGA